MKQIVQSIRDAFSMAIEAIQDNRLRSILTLFGMIVGVFAIIAVMTAIRTLETSINSGLNIFGSNVIYIQKSPAIQMGDHASRRKYWRRPNITYDMGEELKSRMVSAEWVSIGDDRGGIVVKAGKYKTNPNVVVSGVDEFGLEVSNGSLSAGRNIIHEDVAYGRRVVLIGKTVLNKVFPYSDPIDKKILINGISYRVVGIIEPKGELFGNDQDNVVIIPITSYLQYFSHSHTSLGISVKAPSAEDFDAVKEEASDQMRIVRALQPNEENNFEMITNDSLIETFGAFTAGIKMFAFAVSIIALIVAGIGIMNIMLVSVTERIKEIGIRKAIGATRNNILFQFLLEAVFLSLLGGIIGVILGVLAGNGISLIMTVKPVVPMDWVFIGLGVCSAIGVIFGIYPAYKAASLDPIESLRFE
jgi:putative ABC transport system permease protein